MIVMLVGMMCGVYFCVVEDGECFEVLVDEFVLYMLCMLY